MADSLSIAGVAELLGGGVASTNDACAGVIYQLAPGFDWGAPQPDTDQLVNLILDGERPLGRRASNRTITLPLVLRIPPENSSGDLATDRLTLAAAREVLLHAIDQPDWSLVFTRDPGAGTPLPMVLDCYRAAATVVAYSLTQNKQLLSQLQLTFQALPYGRSDTKRRIAFAAPVSTGPPPPPSPVVLDNFSTINSPQFTQSGRCIVGPATAYWDPANPPYLQADGRGAALVYPATFASSVDLTGMTSVSFWLGLASRYWWNLERHGRSAVTVGLTLTDTSGAQVGMTYRSPYLPVSPTVASPAWRYHSLQLPQNDDVFDYASVAGYTLTIRSRSAAELRWLVAYLDALTARPSSVQASAPVARGSIYTLHGVAGSARSPLSLQFQQAATPGTPTTVTTAGNGTYTVPSNTAYLKVEGIGGGGAGAGMTGAGVGGGGGGAEYSREDYFPIGAIGDVIPYTVGAGGVQGATPVDGQDTVFGPDPNGGSLAVIANGGASALQNSITGALPGTGSTNTIKWPGGAGRTASGSVGGGGGSSGGTGGPGQTPQGTSNVVLTGSGNFTVPPGVTQLTVTAIGPGGSGGTGGSGSGGGGSGGESATQTFSVTPGQVIAYACGTGGAAVSTNDHAGNPGSASTTFGPVGGVTLTAHPGQAGPSSTHGVTAAPGGTGSGAPAHFNGGAGGGNNPYPGSGGSSAGTSAAGNPGQTYSQAGAAAPVGGGPGGASSGPHSANGVAGTVPGGGGGGTWNAGFTSGAGANGQITVSYPGGAPTNNGGPAVPGGGAGGAGGGSANTPGAAGSAPGGGGGGADSTGTAEAGGAGGAGKLIITPYQYPTFKTLIAHRPPAGSPRALVPYVSVGAGADVPNGSTDYTVPSLVSGVAPAFDGTYSIVAIASSFHSPAVSRTLKVTVKQQEYSGGPTVTVDTLTLTYVPNTDQANGIVQLGYVTLPIKQLPPDNTSAIFKVSITSGDTADRFYDLLFLSTQGQTLIINEPTTGYVNYWAEEPSPGAALGLHLGSATDRTQAVSVIDACVGPFGAISGGPLTVDPGDNLLMVYSLEGIPAVDATYYDRCMIERTS
jgi:hypothetical protein